MLISNEGSTDNMTFRRGNGIRGWFWMLVVMCISIEATTILAGDEKFPCPKCGKQVECDWNGCIRCGFDLRVKMPDVIRDGRTTEEEATAAIEKIGLTVGETKEEYSEQDVEQNVRIVLRAWPQAGKKVSRCTKAVLVVSKGPPPVTVPRVSGKTEKEASEALAREDLYVDSPPGDRYDKDVQEGLVAGTDPPGGQEVPRHSHVRLILSKGRDPQEVAAEAYNRGKGALDNKDFAEAKKQFEIAVEKDKQNANYHNALGVALCGLQNYSESVSEYKEAIRLHDKAAVFHVNLAAALLKLGQCEDAKKAADEAKRLDPSIEHWVFKELPNCPKGIPELRGKSYDEAERLLKTLGLRVNKETDYDPDIRPGFVVRTVPGAGSTKKPGADIAVVVSVVPAELCVRIYGDDALEDHLSVAVKTGGDIFDVEQKNERDPDQRYQGAQKWTLKLPPGDYAVRVRCDKPKHRDGEFDVMVHVTADTKMNRCSLRIETNSEEGRNQIKTDRDGDRQYIWCKHTPGEG